jgi:hypothetical protein
VILHIVIGIVTGGSLGFGSHKFVGCSSGDCPLTSHPVLSTIYGAVFGVLVAASFY